MLLACLSVCLCGEMCERAPQQHEASVGLPALPPFQLLLQLVLLGQLHGKGRLRPAQVGGGGAAHWYNASIGSFLVPCAASTLPTLSGSGAVTVGVAGGRGFFAP